MSLVNIVEQHLINHWLYFKNTTDSYYIDDSSIKYIYATPYNRILYVNGNSENDVNEIIKNNNQIHDPLMWIVGPSSNISSEHDSPEKKGLSYLEKWTGMILTLTPSLMNYRTDSDFEFVRVSNSNELDQWVNVYLKGYGKPLEGKKNVFNRFYQIILNGEIEYQLYLGLYKNTPAVAGSIFFNEGVAGLYCIATAPEMRRKGLATFYLQSLLYKAYEQGATRCILHATDAGKPVYQKLGFESCCEFDVYIQKM